jgi:hypothetical protein
MKKILFLFVILLLIFLSSLVSACINFPIVETKHGNFSIDEFNETKIIEKFNSYNSNNNIFNENDIIILKNFIINRYSVNEQTDEEYKLFLKQVKKTNKRWFCGKIYGNVTREDRWTGYRLVDKERNIFGFKCVYPQYFCG